MPCNPDDRESNSGFYSALSDSPIAYLGLAILPALVMRAVFMVLSTDAETTLGTFYFLLLVVHAGILQSPA